MKKQAIISFLLVLFALPLLQAQERTRVEDHNFLVALETLGFGVNYNDKTVLTADINTLTELNVFNKNINDLTGIRDFIALENLNCANNQLTSLDLSYNPKLVELNCSSNQITGGNLKISNNTALEKLNCSDNLLTNNLNVSDNILLKSLDFSTNQISGIDLKTNDLLKILKGANNRLTELNVSANKLLEELSCSNNQIKILDLSINSNLKNLIISSNQIKILDLKEKDSLSFLDISNNQIKNVELNKSRLLKNLIASDNQLVDLDLSVLDSLTILGVSDNEIKTLDISKNLRLENVTAANNQIKNIDFSYNRRLKEIAVYHNIIDEVDLSANDSITAIDFSFNLLANVDLANNKLLKRVNLANNKLTEISLTQNDNVSSLIISNNKLINVNLKNGNNKALVTLFTQNNEDLYCIQIDDSSKTGDTWVTDKHTGYIDDLTDPDGVCSPKTYIPDENFELALIAKGFDTGVPDNLVLTANIVGITDLDLTGSGIPGTAIKSLVGIEDFINLRTLKCSTNALNVLKIEHNLLLEELNCSNNDLEALNIRLNNNLKIIDCSENKLINLDVRFNSNLESLICSKNLLYRLNAKNKKNAILAKFDASENPNLLCIEIDDVNSIGTEWIKDPSATYNERCTPLYTYIPDTNFELALINKGFDIGEPDNYVPTINISGITDLDITGSGIPGSEIKSLVGIENFLALETLNCSMNLIKNLNLSLNNKLSLVDCSNNKLERLNIKNGNNINLVTFKAEVNPNLICIEIDDINNINANWSKDSAASYNESCDEEKTYIPDANFEQALIDLGYDSGQLDKYVSTKVIGNVINLDVSKKGIFDLTGIEDFENLISLNCSENNISALDISQNIDLLNLVCFSNYLSELNINSNTALLNLNCGNNKISSIDVSQNTKLLQLICDKNYLNDLDLKSNLLLKTVDVSSNHIANENLVANNKQLTRLFCGINDFKKINLFSNNSLVDLNCSKNYIEDLGLNGIASLKTLDASLNFLKIINFEKNVNLQKVNVNSNDLKYLEFNYHSKLDSLSCNNNKIQKGPNSQDVDIDGLVLSGANNLKYLSASTNRIDNINISPNKELVFLDLGKNLLRGSSLNVNSNTKLTHIDVGNNQLDFLELEKNVDLQFLRCSYNKFQEINVQENINLIEIDISNNLLTGIELDSIPLLKLLNIDNNEIEYLDLSNNLELEKLDLSTNLLLQLDVKLNGKLTSLQARSNKLNTINIKNENNTALKTFNCSDNPDLDCIQVDNLSFAQENENWIKDETATYKENCRYSDTFVPDDNFESALSAITGVPDDNDDYIPTLSIKNIKSLDVSSKKISSLIGIQDFHDLEILNINDNAIDSLNLSNNEALKELMISKNLLDTLDLSNNNLLEVLDISYNQFASIKTDNLKVLKSINADFNVLTNLNLNDNSELESLRCTDNRLSVLRVKNGNNINLSTFNVTINPDLTCIEIDNDTSFGSSWEKDDSASYSKNCHYNETYVPDDAFEQALINAGYDYDGVVELDDYIPNKKIIAATSLSLTSKEIKDLTGLDAFVNLVSLNINSNKVSILDISNNLKLEKLYCTNNLLTNLVLNKNKALQIVECGSNPLTNVDFSNNTLLSQLNLDSNKITNLDLQNNINLKKLHCSTTDLTSLNLAKNINLEELKATSNKKLLVIDIKSGNNERLKNVNVTSNPLLNCITVDDRAAAISNAKWIKDKTSSYKLFCDDDDNDGVVNSDDLCGSTPYGDFVDLFGCTIFSLPQDNFTILVTGETCRNSNNGIINIISKAVLNFKATISNQNFTNTINFGASTEIRNLKADVYNLCITIDERPNYKICFEIVITEPADLKVISSINEADEKVSLKMSGGLTYSIDLNGKIYKTTESNISLSLDKGVNKLKVKTDSECQGIYEKTIFVADDMVFYPNPFEDQITVYVGNEKVNEVFVNIYSNVGKLVLSESLPVQNGFVNVNGSHLGAGIYIVALTTENSRSTFKIVKK